jgi:hypothetical protein
LSIASNNKWRWAGRRSQSWKETIASGEEEELKRFFAPSASDIIVVFSESHIRISFKT